MKRLLLTFVALAVVTATYADKNPFQKNKGRELARKNAITKFELQNRSSSTVDVAKTIKASNWDTFNNIWDSSTAKIGTYANDRLVSELILSYSLTDTFRRNLYTYDANGRYVLVENQNFNPMTHSFTNDNRYSYTYSTNGNYTELYETYNTITNTWYPSFRTSYEFNSRKAQIKMLGEIYTNGQWSISFAMAKNITYYNNTNKTVQVIDSSYNSGTYQMEADYGLIYSYNNAGQAVRIEGYNYANNVGSLVEVDSVKYDGAGLPISLTIYDPTTMEASFRLNDLTWNGTFNPDINLFDNQPSSYITNQNVNNTWVIIERFTTTYPDNYGSKIALNEVYQNNIYTPVIKYHHINDFNFNEIENSEQNYNTTTATWEVAYGNQYTYQYDANNRTIEYITKHRYSSDTAYVNDQKFEYSDFITISTGLYSSKTIETKLFPNPTSNGSVSINLNLEKSSSIIIDLMDLNGRLISSQSKDFGQGLNTIQLDGLTQGLYFVVISSEYGVSRTKLMVK